ncbi:M3 family metallopeptidase [Ramlibacter sp. XY19]|uniref:M3 family metallopeptidase n=1 Tax=Ramlibacter paludis TaxID=2908000 RepID=UPI0023DAB2EC|nr:M3 family metallopeptidase [Ramlibacter paludis]MCG2593394.1 M3 family metallopeptidase [Ramlibacter paludis]
MQATNPLLRPWTAPYGLPPFAEVQPAHFEPALTQAMRQQREELDAIAANPEAPSFDNTIAAFDRSGRSFGSIQMLFQNLCASETSPALQEVQRQMAPALAAHESAIYMHAGLFRRVAALHEKRAALGLATEQLRLLERVHLNFVRAGALLAPAAQKRYAEIMQQLAALNTAFAQNVLHDESSWALELKGEADLAGLPESVRTVAKMAAAQRGLGDSHAITLGRASILPFLTFSERRDLREQAWRAWTSRGEHAGEHDNRPLIGQILVLRQEQARLHGYATYADYALVDRMARTPQAVDKLLDDVWERAKPVVERERAALQQAQRAEGNTDTIESWDWRYWAEKVRQRDYAVDDAEVKPYFSLDAMVPAAFDCASRLFGLKFTPRPDIALYHPDARAYEVHDAQQRPVGLFIQDNFARPSKRSGAWMSSLAVQHRNGRTVLPVILNNNNNAKGSPTLLSFDDVRTLFHEFGHGLHGLLSNVTYQELSGTNVLRDYVELPSQLFEHWMSEPEVLRKHARHVETGQPIPDALIAKLQAARKFGQGYDTVRYTASALADMAVHRHPDPASVQDWSAFEADFLRARGLPAATGQMHRLVHFQHLFNGDGYAAGYYVYLWAEVLDADAYDAFREAGSPFAPEVAARLLKCIYSAGNSVEPAEAFRAFRGRDPVIAPLLQKKGLVAA